MANNDATHVGHRSRIRERFLKEGLDNFNEINALEMSLFYCIPRKNTNDLAHRLLEYFGSYCNVLNAPISELKKVHGVSDHVATYLKFQGEAVGYYLTNRAKAGIVVKDTADYGKLLTNYLTGKSNETVYLLCLDAKSKMICCRRISEGSINTASISVRKVVDAAISSNATSVVLAHNHPGGLALPSDADIQTTIRLYDALATVDVILVDHIIVADGDYISLAQSNLFPKTR